MRCSLTSNTPHDHCRWSAKVKAALLIPTGCYNGAHIYCLGLEEVPEGEWFCDACRTDGWVLPSPAASPLTSEADSEEAAASPALDPNPSTTPNPTPRPARRRLRRVRGSAVERSGAVVSTAQVCNLFYMSYTI